MFMGIWFLWHQREKNKNPSSAVFIRTIHITHVSVLGLIWSSPVCLLLKNLCGSLPAPCFYAWPLLCVIKRFIIILLNLTPSFGAAAEFSLKQALLAPLPLNQLDSDWLPCTAVFLTSGMDWSTVLIFVCSFRVFVSDFLTGSWRFRGR